MARQRSRRAAGAPALQRNVADLRALAHPLRLRMMELFAESPKTTKQVAEMLGQPPTRLYHHVAALERAGLLVLTETRQNRGAVEKYYEGVAQRVRGSVAVGTNAAAGRKARRAVAATVLEQTKQELISMPAGAKEAALVGRLVLVAPVAKIPAIRKWLLETVQSMRTEFALDDSDVPDEQCERWAVTVAFAPVASPTQRKARAPGSTSGRGHRRNQTPAE
jgi:DNA-binding transcriptional ArsR family regulator